jgi:hypothetical protein
VYGPAAVTLFVRAKTVIGKNLKPGRSIAKYPKHLGAIAILGVFICLLKAA